MSFSFIQWLCHRCFQAWNVDMSVSWQMCRMNNGKWPEQVWTFLPEGMTLVNTPRSHQTFQGQTPWSTSLIEFRPVHWADGGRGRLLELTTSLQTGWGSGRIFFFFLNKLTRPKIPEFLYEAVGLLRLNLNPGPWSPFSCTLLAEVSTAICQKELFPSKISTGATLYGTSPDRRNRGHQFVSRQATQEWSLHPTKRCHIQQTVGSNVWGFFHWNHFIAQSSFGPVSQCPDFS